MAQVMRTKGRPSIDLQGRRFGCLLVVRKSEAQSIRHTYWDCLCDCGNETRTRGDTLRIGRAQSCGCVPRTYSDAERQRLSNRFKRNLLGARFGRLIVVGAAPNRGQVVRWQCMCDCDTACIVDSRHLTGGAQVSCGCFGRTAAITHGQSHTRGYKAAKKAVRRARASGAGGSYTEAQMRALYQTQNGRCKYCDAGIAYGDIHRDHRVPIALGGNSDISNMQILCAHCNLSKGARHPDEYEAHLTRGLSVRNIASR